MRDMNTLPFRFDPQFDFFDMAEFDFVFVVASQTPFWGGFKHPHITIGGARWPTSDIVPHFFLLEAAKRPSPPLGPWA